MWIKPLVVILTNPSFIWLPLAKPSTEFNDEVYTWGGITAFIGATIFEFGSVLLILEAINEEREGCFGWAVQEVVHNSKAKFQLSADRDECIHHHQNHRSFASGPKKPYNSKWIWWPSKTDLFTHYIYQVGFLACSSQMFGATVFWISGFTALPGIYNHLSTPALKGAYFAPQIIGGAGFIVSGFLFMLETMDSFYKPAWRSLGWHIGLWNTIGGFGFFLCPIFGLVKPSWGAYESGLATFWGSFAFLIASVLQLYESQQKHPVEKSNTKE
jgi:hypothetical protein